MNDCKHESREIEIIDMDLDWNSGVVNVTLIDRCLDCYELASEAYVKVYKGD